MQNFRGLRSAFIAVAPSLAHAGLVAAVIFVSMQVALPAALAGKKTIVGVININDAPASVLQLLAGVGPAKAERIVAYRQRHRFATVEELGRVKGIGPKTVRKLRLFLTVRGPTTAQTPGSTGSGVAGRLEANATSPTSPREPKPVLPGSVPSGPASSPKH